MSIALIARSSCACSRSGAPATCDSSLAQAGGAGASYKIVPGSDHFYRDHEAEVIEILADWLKQFKS
jgi:alpha/beta superfamily hydrolase